VGHVGQERAQGDDELDAEVARQRDASSVNVRQR
jgi:hypothetical protein